MTTTTRWTECSAAPARLFMALELGSKTWKLAFAVTRATGIRIRTIPAGNLVRLWQEIETAKHKLNVPCDAPVRSCSEAVRDGFWVHARCWRTAWRLWWWIRRALPWTGACVGQKPIGSTRGH